jgi:hypothetical protein
VYLRRGEAELPKPVGHRDERLDVLRKMHDRAVGFPVAHRRAVGPARRVHQDRVPVFEVEPLVRPGRRVAGHALSLGHGIAGRFQEAADRGETFGARREPAIAGHARVAVVGTELGRQRERDVQPVGRQEARRTIRPFQQHHRSLRQIVEAKLREFARRIEPIEVGMNHWESRQFVDLHQREGRAWHRDRRIAGEMANHGAGERGFAGSKVTRKRDEVARLERGGDVGHQAHRGLLVRQRHGKA